MDTKKKQKFIQVFCLYIRYIYLGFITD